MVYDKIIKTKDPLVEYSVSFVDLFKMDPNAYPDDAIALGDTVVIYDSELDISDLTARVKKITRDEFHPELTRHTVSNVV